MAQLDQNIIKSLDDSAMARVYHRKRNPAPNSAATFTERLALWLFKATAIANFGLIMFCIGYWSTLYSDGLLFEIPGLVSYWVDFGGAQ